MTFDLASLALALASAAPQGEMRTCQASFANADRFGSVQLTVDGDYVPRVMRVALNQFDGWTRAVIALDPVERHLPGTLSNVFFAVRFTRAPTFPLVMNAYADGRLRWRHRIDIAFWPTSLIGPEPAVRVGRGAPGTSDYLARADDGLPVPTPRLLRIELLDAHGRQVGETRYALLDPQPGGPIATALAAVEAGFRDRACRLPPPLID